MLIQFYFVYLPRITMYSFIRKPETIFFQHKNQIKSIRYEKAFT